jgi:shikimate kinase
VARVLITGLSGTGKSSVVRELAARGHRAVDADSGGLSELVAAPEGAVTGVGGGQDWVWREQRITELLDAPGELFLSGCSPNQGWFYPRFDHVILLTAPAATIVERLRTRSTNDFGKDPGELARTLDLLRTVEPLLRNGADLVIDTRAPLGQVVDTILGYVAGP